MSDARYAGMVSALLSCLVLSAAPHGLAELHDALEEQATLPAAAAHYPRAEPGRTDAVERVRELANEHARASAALLKAAEHIENPQGAAAAAAASAQGQARANQVRKNPGKPPKPNGPHP